MAPRNPQQTAGLAAGSAALALGYWAWRRRSTRALADVLQERFALRDGVTLYGNFASPCTRRVLVHLRLGGVAHAFVEVNLLRGDQRHAAYEATERKS